MIKPRAYRSGDSNVSNKTTLNMDSSIATLDMNYLILISLNIRSFFMRILYSFTCNKFSYLRKFWECCIFTGVIWFQPSTSNPKLSISCYKYLQRFALYSSEYLSVALISDYSICKGDILTNKLPKWSAVSDINATSSNTTYRSL